MPQLIATNPEIITMKTLVSPSLLAADFTDLRGQMEMINRSEADWLHYFVWLPSASSREAHLREALGCALYDREPRTVHRTDGATWRYDDERSL